MRVLEVLRVFSMWSKYVVAVTILEVSRLQNMQVIWRLRICIVDILRIAGIRGLARDSWIQFNSGFCWRFVELFIL